MPIYEYACEACTHKFETLQKFSEEPLKTCPECNQDKLIKLISAAAFRLKGDGWYETDFKSGSKKNIAGSDSSSTKEASESNSTTSNGKDASGTGSSQGKGSDSGTAKATPDKSKSNAKTESSSKSSAKAAPKKK